MIAAIVVAFPLTASEADKPKAISLVKEAVAFGKKEGKAALLHEANNGGGRFHVKSGESLYIFAYSPDGVCQAIGFQGNLVGVNRWNVKDPDGKLLVQEVIKVGKTGGWVTYKYPNPKTGKVEMKASYVEPMGDLVVGCGIYL
jgi:signal transduction histidine kinase